jgi:hypothetical protein
VPILTIPPLGVVEMWSSVIPFPIPPLADMEGENVEAGELYYMLARRALIYAHQGHHEDQYAPITRLSSIRRHF